MGTPSVCGRRDCAVSCRLVRTVPAESNHAGAGARADDRAGFGDPVLHAVEALLRPVAQSAGSLRIVRMERAGVDARARGHLGLDELLEARGRLLAGAHPVDRGDLAVGHFEDGFHREERTEQRSAPGDASGALQVLERVRGREDVRLARKTPGEACRVLERPAVAARSRAGRADERDPAGEAARVDHLDPRVAHLLRGRRRDRVRAGKFGRDGEDDRLPETLGDEAVVYVAALTHRGLRRARLYVRRGDLLVELVGREIDAGGERLVPDVDVQRERTDVELAIEAGADGRRPVDDDREAVHQRSGRTAPATTRSGPTRSAPSSAMSRATPWSGGRPSRTTSTSRPSSVARRRHSSSAAARSLGRATRSSSRVSAASRLSRSTGGATSASDVAVTRSASGKSPCRWWTLTPIPSTSEPPSASVVAWASAPATFLASISTSFGHFTEAWGAPKCSSARATATPERTTKSAGSAGAGRKSQDASRLVPFGASHERPLVPRPAVCSSATTIAPAAPSAASSRARSCVDATLSKNSISRPSSSESALRTASTPRSARRIHDRRGRWERGRSRRRARPAGCG